MSFKSIAAAAAFDQGQKQGYLLSDQEYYDTYIKPREQQIASSAATGARGIGRGQRTRASQFAAAQGLGGSQVGYALQQQGAGLNRDAIAEAMRIARLRGEAYRRQKFAERDRQRAEAGAALSTVGGIETTVASALPFGIGQVAGPVSAGEAAQWQAAYAATPELAAEEAGTRGKPLRAVDYGYAAPTSTRQSDRTRGGGGSDFYRTYGY